MSVNLEILTSLRKLNNLELGPWSTLKLFELFFKDQKNLDIKIVRSSSIVITKNNHLLFKIGGKTRLIHEMAHVIEATDLELNYQNLGMVAVNSSGLLTYEDVMREANVFVYEQLIKQVCNSVCDDLIEADRQAQHFASFVNYFPYHTQQNNIVITTLWANYNLMVSPNKTKQQFINEFNDNVRLLWTRLRKDCRVIIDYWKRKLRLLRIRQEQGRMQFD